MLFPSILYHPPPFHLRWQLNCMEICCQGVRDVKWGHCLIEKGEMNTRFEYRGVGVLSLNKVALTHFDPGQTY